MPITTVSRSSYTGKPSLPWPGSWRLEYPPDRVKGITCCFTDEPQDIVTIIKRCCFYSRGLQPWQRFELGLADLLDLQTRAQLMHAAPILLARTSASQPGYTGWLETNWFPDRQKKHRQILEDELPLGVAQAVLHADATLCLIVAVDFYIRRTPGSNICWNQVYGAGS